jgi:acyl dehydratase
MLEQGLMMPTTLTMKELQQRAGTHLGTSGWYTITQERVNQFAEATDDRQWIHVDPARAAHGPFGTTIAHGYLTLSLAPMLMSEVFEITDAALILNYGLNKVRFPAPLPVNSKVRMRAKLAELEDIPGGAQMVMELTFEREGGDKPVCVAQTVARVYEG